MEKNENKFMSKAKNFLVLVLFTVIYFFFQKTIYPVLALFFWLICAMPLAGIILNALEFLHLPQVAMTTIAVVISGIALIMVLILVFYLGYLCNKFLKKMNKKALIWIMIVILVYFVFEALFENKNSSIMSYLTNGKKYIFCTISHILFVTGAFYSDKVKKILDKIKFKRK